jgi:soluble lytic murein transglycosylase-like protein
VAAGLLAPAGARADIYTWKDSKGVVHFTNIKPKGKAAAKAKRWVTPAGGKAAAKRGACERCDAIPARDRSPERFSRYDAHIREASELYQIPEPLIRAVIKVESDYDPRVVSAVDARGLMQLMPDACTDMRVPRELVFEPRINILGGTRLLRILANRFNGDLVMTIAGYHAGGGAVAKYGGIPPYVNTQKYVQMVLKQYYRFKAQPAAR